MMSRVHSCAILLRNRSRETVHFSRRHRSIFSKYTSYPNDKIIILALSPQLSAKVPILLLSAPSGIISRHFAISSDDICFSPRKLSFICSFVCMPFVVSKTMSNSGYRRCFENLYSHLCVGLLDNEEHRSIVAAFHVELRM
jgi:hypothetical protein